MTAVRTEAPTGAPAKVMARPTVEPAPDTTEELTAAQTEALTAAQTEAPAKVMARPTAEPAPDTTEELTAAQTPERTADRRRIDGGSGGRLGGRPALERLIAISEARFADEFWGSSPLLSRGTELARGFDDLFSLEAADEILSTRGLRTPFIRVAKDGAIVDPSRFTGAGGVGASVGDQVRDERILDLFAAGHTLVLQALHRFWPPLVTSPGR